jgi:hypothetical protein
MLLLQIGTQIAYFWRTTITATTRVGLKIINANKQRGNRASNANQTLWNRQISTLLRTIWRIVKQRLKNRGLILDPTELRRAIQDEWDNVTLKEINRAIDSMPEGVTELNERNGLPIPF